MTINLSNSLIGLSILSGSNSFASGIGAAPVIESKAVRTAKALFTLKDTTPPWKTGSSPVSYTHLDVYKRQPPMRRGGAFRGRRP